MELPKRKTTRLREYDYSQNGCYFITICTDKRRNILSKLVGQGLAPAGLQLSEYGMIAEEQLLALEARYSYVRLDKYIIMPNHIHAIISIENTENAAGASPRPTLSDIVCSFKSITARKIRQAGFNGSVFQSSFYDHIIRNERDYLEIWKYIDENAGKLENDELNGARE